MPIQKDTHLHPLNPEFLSCRFCRCEFIRTNNKVMCGFIRTCECFIIHRGASEDAVITASFAIDAVHKFTASCKYQVDPKLSIGARSLCGSGFSRDCHAIHCRG